MSESTCKLRERYVDPTKDKYKQTCIIHGPIHSSDEYKVLGYFNSKYSRSRPTKDRGKDPIKMKKFNINQENNYMFQHAVGEIILQKNNKLSA